MTEWVWGVDVAVKHVAFGFAPVPSGPIETEELFTDNQAREGERLGLLDRQLRIFASQAAQSHPPACVWVEQPSGAYQSPQLLYATGVVQAALFEILEAPVWTIPSGKWKKTAIGDGRANKERVRSWVKVQHNLMTKAYSQDEYDAYAIAYAGREILRTRKWDAA